MCYRLYVHVSLQAHELSGDLGAEDAANCKSDSTYTLQVNKKFRKFESKYRDCIKRNGDKIGTQTCYVIST